MKVRKAFLWLTKKISLLKLELIKKIYPVGYFVRAYRKRDKSFNFWFDKNTDNGFILGFYEKDLVFELENLLQPKMVFFDLGAHWGYFSLIASKLVGPEGKVYSFEPLPHNYNRLIKNVQANSVQNISCFNVAVSSEEGTVMFSNTSDSFANTYINAKKDAPLIEIKTICLDDFILKNNNPPPQMIKIDVEGAEYDVLSGAKKIIETYKPILHLSTHDLHQKGVDKLCRDMLESYGYHLKLVSSHQNGLIMDYICTCN